MFVLCLRFFQICGMYPVEIKEIPLRNNEEPCRECLWKTIRYFWMFMHLSFVIGVMLFMWIEQDEMLYAETVIGKINDVLVYFSLVFAHLTIIIETFLQRKYFEDYWNFYTKVR